MLMDFFLKQIYSSSEALNCTTVKHFCGTNFQGPQESGFLTDLPVFCGFFFFFSPTACSGSSGWFDVGFWYIEIQRDR